MALRDHIDELQAKWIDLCDRLWKVRNAISTVIRWSLITAVPIWLGLYFEAFIKEEITLQSIFSLLISTKYYPMPILFLLFIIGTAWSVNSQSQRARVDMLSHSLRWLYIDMGFDNLPDDDIRCTVWAPVNSKASPQQIKMLQVVNYYPRFETRGNVVNSYRMNQFRGRIKRVARKEGQNILPLGITGACIIDSLRDHKAYIMRDSLDGVTGFEAYIRKQYNYNWAEIKRLTQDRRSYMAVPVMDAAFTDVLGVIFFDSRKPNAFTDDVEMKVQKYLTMIAEALVVNDRSQK